MGRESLASEYNKVNRKPRESLIERPGSVYQKASSPRKPSFFIHSHSPLFRRPSSAPLGWKTRPSTLPFHPYPTASLFGTKSRASLSPWHAIANPMTSKSYAVASQYLSGSNLLLAQRRYSLYRQLIHPLLKKKSKQLSFRESRQPVSSSQFELTHPNYRQLSWTLTQKWLLKQQSTFERFRNPTIRSASVPSTATLRMSDEEVSQLGLLYRTKNAVHLCYKGNPLNKVMKDIIFLGRNLKELTGDPCVILNDYRYLNTVQSKILKKLETHEVPGDVTPEEHRPNLSRPDSVNRASDRKSSVFPPLPPTTRSSMQRRITKAPKPVVLNRPQSEPLKKLRHSKIANTPAIQREEAMQELYFQKPKTNESVTHVLNRVWPQHGSEMNALFELATMVFDKKPNANKKLQRVKVK